MRRCSKPGCQEAALATLTYNYADSQVVIGPLSQRVEPHAYDLCSGHAQRTTAPRGWEVIRLDLPAAAPAPSSSTPGSPVGPGAPAVTPARPALRVVDDGR